MELISAWPCWEIMKCGGREECPAGQNPLVPCWEIIRELDDYRTAFEICHDCIVYLVKQKNTVLSAEELQAILENKGICVLAAKYSQAAVA